MSNKDPRNRDLAKIHLGAKQLGMDDDAYRAMLWTVAKVRSSSELSVHGRKDVLNHLSRCGAVFTRKPRPRPAKDRKAIIGKIRAFLAEAKRPDAYADGMAKKMFGIDCFEWLDHDQLRRVVAALTYDAQRHGRRI